MYNLLDKKKILFNLKRYKKKLILKKIKKISFISKEININMYHNKKYKLSTFLLKNWSTNLFFTKYFYYIEWINKFKLFTLKKYLKLKQNISFKNKNIPILDIEKNNIPILDIKISKKNNTPILDIEKKKKKKYIKKKKISKKKNLTILDIEKKKKKIYIKNKKVKFILDINFWNINAFDSYDIKFPNSISYFKNNKSNRLIYFSKQIKYRKKYHEEVVENAGYLVRLLKVISYKKDLYTFNYLRGRVKFDLYACNGFAFRKNRNFHNLYVNLNLNEDTFICYIWIKFKKLLNLILILSNFLYKKRKIKKYSSYNSFLSFLLYKYIFLENLFFLIYNFQFIRLGFIQKNYFYEQMYLHSKHTLISDEDSFNFINDINSNSTLGRIISLFCLLNKKKSNNLKKKLVNNYLRWQEGHKTNIVEPYNYLKVEKHMRFEMINQSFLHLYSDFYSHTDKKLEKYITNSEKRLKNYWLFFRRYSSWWSQNTRSNYYYSFDSEEDILFSLFFTNPLDIKDVFNYKTINKSVFNNFNILNNVLLFKCKNTFFKRIKNHFSLYYSINKYFKFKNYNTFYINTNWKTYVKYVNSYYKRHLINKFKFKTNKKYFKYNLKYNSIIFNNPNFNKKKKKFKYLYNYSYESKYNTCKRYLYYYGITERFISFFIYYEIQKKKDVFNRFKEFKIRNTFKKIYIYFFFKWFKKKIYYHAFSNLFNFFFNIKKERILLKKKLTLCLNLDSIGIITYKNTLKNIFITLSKYNGNQLFNISSGSLGIFGYKKRHYNTIKNVIKTFFYSIEKVLDENSISKIKLVVNGYISNFNYLMFHFVRRLSVYDRLTVAFMTYLLFLKKYMIFIKNNISKKKKLFSINFNNYFSIINYGYHLINYIYHKKRRIPHKFRSLKILFIQIKSKKSFF